MILNINDNEFKAAVRAEIKKVVTRDAKKEISDLFYAELNKFVEPTAEKIEKSLKKAMLEDNGAWGTKQLVPKINAIMEKHAEPVIAALVTPLIEKKIEELFSVYGFSIMNKCIKENKDLTATINKSIEEKIAQVFADRFFAK